MAERNRQTGPKANSENYYETTGSVGVKESEPEETNFSSDKSSKDGAMDYVENNMLMYKIPGNYNSR